MTDTRCKYCRKHLFEGRSVQFLTAHGEIKNSASHVGCPTAISESCLYMSVEDVPQWIQDIIDKENWTKGRINCPFCNSRLGSFNFVSQLKCDCGEFLTPPISIIHSKVDVLFNNEQDSVNTV